MAWRIAVTSADGVLVNRHFGHADFFYIVDIERDGAFTIVEKREAEPWCAPGSREKDGESGDGGIARRINDCAAVLTARIGPPARRKLEMAGLSVFEESAVIADAAKKLAAYYGKIRQPETAVTQP